jgi:hypothetical protein
MLAQIEMNTAEDAEDAEQIEIDQYDVTRHWGSFKYRARDGEERMGEVNSENVV